MNPPKTWLWLDDEFHTIYDALTSTFIKKLNVKRFQSIVDIIQELITIKENPHDDLSNYGLILDLLIRGASYIDIPVEWTNTTSFSLPTDRGYDAGISFAEIFVMNMVPSETSVSNEPPPFWSPPPPIIFYTIMAGEIGDTYRRIQHLKIKWAKYHNTTVEKANISFARKFDDVDKVFENLFSQWFE